MCILGLSKYINELMFLIYTREVKIATGVCPFILTHIYVLHFAVWVERAPSGQVQDSLNNKRKGNRNGLKHRMNNTFMSPF